jgi:hypothetical protein
VTVQVPRTSCDTRRRLTDSVKATLVISEEVRLVISKETSVVEVSIGYVGKVSMCLHRYVKLRLSKG